MDKGSEAQQPQCTMPWEQHSVHWGIRPSSCHPHRQNTEPPGTFTDTERWNDVPVSSPSKTSWGLTLNRQSMGVDVIWDSTFILCLRNSLSPTPSESCGHHTSQTPSQILPRKGPGTSPDIQPRSGPQGLSPTQISEVKRRSSSVQRGNKGR